MIKFYFYYFKKIIILEDKSVLYIHLIILYWQNSFFCILLMDDNQKKLKIIQTIKDNNTRDLELLSDDIKKMTESSFEIRLNGTQNIRDQIEKDSNIPENNITLLHVAAYYDSLECFIFLQTKTNLNLRVESANGLFPLHYAC